jgi:hypothetical protein
MESSKLLPLRPPVATMKSTILMFQKRPRLCRRLQCSIHRPCRVFMWSIPLLLPVLPCLRWKNTTLSLLIWRVLS